MGKDILQQRIERIGCELREARKTRNLTQAKVAEKVGIRANELSMIERGKKIPNLDLVVKICEELGSQVRIVVID